MQIAAHLDDKSWIRGLPMRDPSLQPWITRRSALKMASAAAALPALIRPAPAAEPSVIRVAFAIQPATLDPQKNASRRLRIQRCGLLLQSADHAGCTAPSPAGPGDELGGERGLADLDLPFAPGGKVPQRQAARCFRRCLHL